MLHQSVMRPSHYTLCCHHADPLSVAVKRYAYERVEAQGVDITHIQLTSLLRPWARMLRLLEKRSLSTEHYA